MARHGIRHVAKVRPRERPERRQDGEPRGRHDPEDSKPTRAQLRALEPAGDELTRIRRDLEDDDA